MIAYVINAILDHVPWYVYLFVGLLALVASIPYWLPVWNVLPVTVRWLLVVIATAGLAYFAGRNKAARDAAQAREKANANAIANRRKVDATIVGTSDAGVVASLDKWMRE